MTTDEVSINQRTRNSDIALAPSGRTDEDGATARNLAHDAMGSAVTDASSQARELWARASAIFAEALDHQGPARATFLAHATQGDAALRREVDSLLRAHDDAEAEAFLATPAPLGDAAALFSPSTMPKRIGAYRLVRAIGERRHGHCLSGRTRRRHLRETGGP